MQFTECLSDSEKAISDLSSMLKIPYNIGSFSDFESSFIESGLDEDFFLLKSEQLEISVHLEKYEGYFFVTVSGSGASFELAKDYLVEHSKGN